MRHRIMTALMLLALAPVALQAQSEEARIEEARTRMQSAGIPVSLIESKIEEGKAKGVPLDRIAFAVERRAAALVQAQTAMSRSQQPLSEADLVAGADALGIGVSQAVLGTISEAAPRERRAVAIAALTELVAMDVVPEEALERVLEALARGPDALASLPAQAAEARVRRGPPAGVGPTGGTPAGPPAAIPAPGQRPGAANPAGPGRPDAPGRPGGN
jgi:hypothetical protein